MAMSNGANRTPEQIDAANKWQSYRMGWLAGAAIKAIDPRFSSHPNQELNAAYQLGYRDGGVARREALARATELYGYEPTILRLA